jgi:rare lipoprotein A
MVFLSSCGIVKRTSLDDDMRILDTGIASWYGPEFHGRPTANGETFNMNDLTAAHRTLPFNTMLRVENLDNGKSVSVRINDRGPYVGNRIIDLSRKAAREIDMIGTGTARVALYLIREGDRPITAQNASSRETFTVQIASFNRETDANRESGTISGSRVEKVTIGNNTVYRVYYGTFRNVSEARAARDRLAQNGVTGFVKQMEN